MAQFDKNYFHKKQDIDPRHHSKKKEPNIEIFRSFIMKLPINARVLDIGCGTGDKSLFVNIFRPDIKIYAIDIADTADLLPDYINFKRGDINDIDTIYNENYFDAVYCFHVLEHILYPSDLVAKIKKILKEEGGIYIEVPYWTTAYLAPLSPISFWGDPTHLNIWTKLKGYRTLSMNGFKDIFIKTSPVHNFLPSKIKNIKNNILSKGENSINNLDYKNRNKL